MVQKNNFRGFTLIELLVVISVIGLLASVVLVALNSARLKARDAKRKADLKQLNTALNLYYQDNNAYPNCVGWVYSTDPTWNTTSCLYTALKPYLSKLPLDPTNNSNSPWVTGDYSYAYISSANSNLQDYDLVGQLENTTDTQICQFKQWLFHYYIYNPPIITSSWCSNADGNHSYSKYMIADH